MKRTVYANPWAGNPKWTPKQILEENGISYLWKPPKEGKSSGTILVDISAEQLFKLTQDSRVDMMVTKNFIAFDEVGKLFRTR